MRIILSPKARKQLIRLPAKESIKITRKLHLLEDNPFSGKLLSGKLQGIYSLHAWPYRITYQIFKDKQLILIDTVEHRQGVYKGK